VNAGEWELGDIMCDTWVALDVMCCTASILNLAAIGVDRCPSLLSVCLMPTHVVYCSPNSSVHYDDDEHDHDYDYDFFSKEKTTGGSKITEIKVENVLGSAPHSGRSSSIKPLCSKIELNRCTATEIR